MSVPKVWQWERVREVRCAHFHLGTRSPLSLALAAKSSRFLCFPTVPVAKANLKYTNGDSHDTRVSSR